MFRKYIPRGAKVELESDSVRISNLHLAFSKEVWEKCFKKAACLSCFFEEENNRIGLKGEAAEGYVIHDDPSGAYKVVRWGGFIKSIKFVFEKPESRKITNRDVSCADLWVISGDFKPK